MNPDVLEQVLECPRLPSLPAVALRVIELTQDREVAVTDLAEIITRDQALAAKVLRTVNSSFYALSKPCSSINQAIVLLGLTAVKTLALGFTLVGAISKTAADDFDYRAYWRRGLLTGIAAKHIARAAEIGSEEECFLGGLLQDVGMVAMHLGLGRPYREVLAQCAGNHRKLARLELAAFEIQHADVGALIASRWRLPESLVMPIKYHERPTAAPREHAEVVFAVGLGNIACDVLDAEEPAGPLTRFYGRAEQWLRLNAAQADDVLREVGQVSKEIAALFHLDAGQGPDGEAILARARQRLLSLTITGHAEEPTDGGDADPVSGLPTRTPFDRTLIAAFEQCTSGGPPLSLALFDIDGLDELTVRHGDATRDATVVEFARRLGDALASTDSTLYRLDTGRFAALMPGTNTVAATRLAEAARRRIHGVPLVFPPGTAAVSSISVSTSAGLVCLDSAGGARFSDAAQFLSYAERAVQAAASAGRNTLRVFTPVPRAA
ncbi:MAG: HDOD domain-containing protein [Phycisphaeraceae bacterium]|nr:HDOD domain-containing protein [Phycisphaeraceae bacterium]